MNKIRWTAFRIAIAFAAALAITTYAVFALVYWQFYAANVVLVRSVLQDEVRQTADTPIARLRQRLELRLTQDLRHLDYVGLYDPSGSLTFGNIAKDVSIPADGRAYQRQIPPPEPEAWQSENVIFVAARRTDGSKIVLGRSLVYVDQLEAAMLRVFTAAVVPVALLALGLGFLVSLRAARRLASLQTAIDRVVQGDLDVRLPTRGTPDDIDALARAVNSMLDELVRLVNQIKNVGDNIAHDLRAPLAVMRARLERGLAGSEATLRGLTVEALGDLDRAMTTVSALLRISALETSLRRSAFASVDLRLVCRDAFELYEALGDSKGLAMRLEAETPTLVTGDGDLLREAVANLVENAVKYTPRGGSVTLACGHAGALVRVSDTGRGVAPDEREKIAKRLYRSQAVGEEPGVGLGLHIATTIIDLHGFGLTIKDGCPGAIFEIVGPKTGAGTATISGRGKNAAVPSDVRRLAD